MTWTFVVGSIFTLTLKPRTAVCRLAVDMGPCRDSFNRWYFDVERSTCLPFVYGGCAGNMNRFKTYDTCINFCSAAIDAARSSPPTGFSLFSLEYFRVLVKASCPLRCLVSSSVRSAGQFGNFSTHFPTFHSIAGERDNEVDVGPVEITTRTSQYIPEDSDPCASALSQCRSLQCPYGVER